MNIPVVVKVDVDPDTVRRRLIASFDRPLSDKRHLPTIGPWTVFGEVRGDEIRAESAGAFEGWTARSGYGFWQPIFRGHVRSTREGSVIEGTIRFRLTVWILVLFLVVLAISLVPRLLPIAGQDIAAGNYGRAVPPIVLILGIVVLPAVWTAHVVWMGRREGYALRDRVVQGLVGSPRAGTLPNLSE
jgi:hypothetical protein